MEKKKTKPRINLDAPAELIEKFDQYWRARPQFKNRADAVRHLMEEAISAPDKAKNGTV